METMDDGMYETKGCCCCKKRVRRRVRIETKTDDDSFFKNFSSFTKSPSSIVKLDHKQTVKPGVEPTSPGFEIRKKSLDPMEPYNFEYEKKPVIESNDVSKIDLKGESLDLDSDLANLDAIEKEVDAGFKPRNPLN